MVFKIKINESNKRNKNQKLICSYSSKKREKFNVVFPTKKQMKYQSSCHREISPLKGKLKMISEVKSTERIQITEAKKTIGQFKSFNKIIGKNSSRSKETVTVKLILLLGKGRNDGKIALTKYSLFKRNQEEITSENKKVRDRKRSAKASTLDTEKTAKKNHSQISNILNNSIFKQKYSHQKLDSKMEPLPLHIPINSHQKGDQIYPMLSIFRSNLLNFENRIRGSISHEKHKYCGSAQKLLLESVNEGYGTNKSMNHYSRFQKLPKVFKVATPVKNRAISHLKNAQS